MTIRGILFDVDDTLIDYSASVRIGLLRHLAAVDLLGRFPTPEAAVARWHALEEDVYPRFLAGELTFTGQQRVRTERFLAELGVIVPDPGAWFAAYAAHRDTAWACFPDVPPTLRRYAGRLRLGIISNASRPYQIGKLRTVGLLRHFGDAILCSDEFGCAKPDPAIFRAGCAMLGLPPHEVAYIGDRYDVDALGAESAGLQAFWLNRTPTAAIAHPAPACTITTIASLTDLDPLLPAALLSAPPAT